MTKSRMIKKNISNGVKKIKGGIIAPKGFFQSGVHCGLKKKKLDLALILSENHVKAKLRNDGTCHQIGASQKGIKQLSMVDERIWASNVIDFSICL